jgi:hypothetical protein
MAPATRASWKTQPMPEARASIPYERAFDAAEHERVTRGIVPEQMEDKWFVFHEGPWLWFHRSWTGVAIYAVKLRITDTGSAVEEAWANRSPEQYRETDDVHDAAILSYLVERLLLGHDARFPVRASVDPEKVSLLVHHVVGHARANDEE